MSRRTSEIVDMAYEFSDMQGAGFYATNYFEGKPYFFRVLCRQDGVLFRSEDYKTKTGAESAGREWVKKGGSKGNLRVFLTPEEWEDRGEWGLLDGAAVWVLCYDLESNRKRMSYHWELHCLRWAWSTRNVGGCVVATDAGMPGQELGPDSFGWTLNQVDQSGS